MAPSRIATVFAASQLAWTARSGGARRVIRAIRRVAAFEIVGRVDLRPAEASTETVPTTPIRASASTADGYQSDRASSAASPVERIAEEARTVAAKQQRPDRLSVRRRLSGRPLPISSSRRPRRRTFMSSLS